ncbi:MAG: RNA polymerase sigma factor [Oscillospiraceae bacterium]
MIGNHPKRRKDKYNPYKICENNGRYYLSFKDGQGVQHEMEIQKDLFDMLNRFELDDLSTLNEWDRHIEHFEQTEQSLNRRACYKAELVEDTVLRNIEYEQLHQTISMLTETQQRRLKLYYFRGLTYKRISEMEGCSISAVGGSISAAIENIKKILSR